MQLFKVQASAPPPEAEAELPLNVQLFKVQPSAPPPYWAELPLKVQLFSLPE